MESYKRNDSFDVVMEEADDSDVEVEIVEFAFAQRVLDFFNFYYLAFVIIFGMVGNTLSFLVFTRTHLKLRSSSYYLAALALADLGFLLTLLIVWLDHVGIDLFNRQGFCQALVFGSSVSSCLSVWLTVAFTVERLIAVQYPLHRPSMCTVQRAKIIISVLTFITLSTHVYSFFTAGITEDYDGKAVCDLLPGYYKVMYVVNTIDTVFTLVIPFILIVVMNALIAKNLFVFSRTFKKPRSSHQHIPMKTLRMTESKWREDHDSGQESGSIQSHPSNGNIASCNFVQLQPHHLPSSSSGNNVNRLLSSRQEEEIATVTQEIILQQQMALCSSTGGVNAIAIHQSSPRDVASYHQEKLQYRNILSIRIQYSITKMLLLISSVFIMLNLPSYVIRLQVFVSDVMATSSYAVSSSMVWILQQFFMLLYYTNFSINFLLYSTCGTTFRHCLCRLIRDKIDSLRFFFSGFSSCHRCSSSQPES